ncbi:hypothetical protein ER308_10935 [Egibacter rhizosphaerae]|uniref:Prenyltransferase n=1 Tax=Egibacter rhizosphaerae TaxID=1670831 RepID=A0A411YFJ9_9ACTN|nr:hypothetical protein [Egibacter rhizosphaerae]QBI20023.1 hypothetical protein ER308_10935 [Egibacter rhizosphaerae]
MDDTRRTAARTFLYRNGRVLERRLFAALFEGADPAGVVEALRGYQNPDGGFGHGLEPDKRCPHSIPADVEVALGTLAAAGTVDEPMVSRACDWLVSIADPSGAVPLGFPVIEGYPRADHWAEWTYELSLFPTAGLVGLLHRLGVVHPWRDRAEAWCWTTMEAEIPREAHAIADCLCFLEHVPDRPRAEKVAAGVADALAEASFYRGDPDSEEYGVTPLYLAPTAASPWRELFSDELIAAHLDRLEADQQDDGGWPIQWDPPSEASILEWRGIETLRARRVLDAYGR